MIKRFRYSAHSILLLSLTSILVALFLYLFGTSQSFQVGKWYLALQLCALAAAPLAFKLFSMSPDSGWGLTKLFGIFIVAWIAWVLSLVGLAFSTKIVVASILILSLTWFKDWEYSFKQIITNKSEIYTVEALFLCLFACLIIVRSFIPEISWGEKPMDFSFLNYFVRTETMPPQDPWAAGHTMQYYYFGFIALSVLHHLSQVSTSIGFNLSLCTIIPIAACALYSALRAIGMNKISSISTPLAIYLFSNIETVRAWIFDHKPTNFDSFWASSRAFQSPGINENPFWAFIFGDLHAHFIALPLLSFAVVAGVLIHNSIRQSEISRYVFPTGIALGALLATNSWDFLTSSTWLAACIFWPAIPLLALTLLCFIFLPNEIQDIKFIAVAVFSLSFITLLALKTPVRQARAILLSAAAIAAVAAVTALPWILTSAPAHSPGWGFNSGNEMNSLLQILKVHGLWLLGILSLDIFLAVSISNNSINPHRSFLTLTYTLTPLVLAAVSWQAGNSDFSIGIVLLSSLVAFIGVSAYQSESVPSKFQPFGLAIASAAILITASELFYFIDRMNTLFKVHNTIWLLLGLGTFSLLGFVNRVNLAARSIFLPFLLACALGVTASIINLKASLFEGSPRAEGARPTLDGTAYLKEKHPDDLAMYNWINQNISGTPTMIEAFGASYQSEPFSRVVMHTGIPTVLGWEYHVSQRGVESRDIDERKRAIRKIYTTPQSDEAITLLQRFNVDLIYLGERERQAYPGRGIMKFDLDSDNFKLLARFGGDALFTLSSSPFVAIAQNQSDLEEP